VLQKKVRHTSSIYKGAQMPHMQRLTWSGIALHAGHLPGYPASAGCVRMPIDFAANLFSVTIGYGDIVPVSQLARMLAIVEAVAGMFYVTLLIARLVSLYSANQARND
jgi:Ion channel/L,D-transpeptidase catalytic domain